MTKLERIIDRRIGILGMARSGIAAAELAQALGGKPFVSDSAAPEALSEVISTLRNMGIENEVGGHSEKLLKCDYLVCSPGIPLTIPILTQAQQKGIPIFSELEFASWVCPARIIAVTGSNGKTTTTTLIGELLNAAGKDAQVCGNIGFPLSGVVQRMNENSIAVVEVSSFQLETISDFRPEVAVILNLTPDHLDRHGGFEPYREAKYRITENQRDTDLLLLNHDDPELMKVKPRTKAELGCFTTTHNIQCYGWVENSQLWYRPSGSPAPICTINEIAIKGNHNLQNASAAVSSVSHFDVPAETIARVLKSFPGVEHRLEAAGTVAGISFINDSKATNVDSVRWALQAMDSPLYLICGGRDKGSAFAPLIEYARGKVKGIIAIGEAKHKIFDELGQAFPIQFTDSLEQAVALAFDLAQPGETVLLSPGCASFDMFENYEERGRVFKTAVGNLKNGKNSDETVPR